MLNDDIECVTSFIVAVLNDDYFFLIDGWMDICWRWSWNAMRDRKVLLLVLQLYHNNNYYPYSFIFHPPPFSWRSTPPNVSRLLLLLLLLNIERCLDWALGKTTHILSRAHNYLPTYATTVWTEWKGMACTGVDTASCETFPPKRH